MHASGWPNPEMRMGTQRCGESFYNQRCERNLPRNTARTYPKVCFIFPAAPAGAAMFA
jgi:hypothetical protein